MITPGGEGPVLTLGLTGGIGAGKTTAARHLEDLGAVVLDADEMARRVVDPRTEGLGAVVDAFGSGVLAPDGSLDRAALARVVFADSAARERLNGILHPRIAALATGRTADLPAETIVVHDVPLLVENGLGPAYHLVLVVGAPAEVRVRRLVTCRGMDEADAWARVAAQADDAARRRAADVWLDNDGDKDALRPRLEHLWHERLVPFELGVRTARQGPRAAPAPVVAPDPGWEDAGRRLAARIARAAGAVALRVDHCGSTSVRGLDARDIIDLHLVVPSLAAADGVGERLGAAGFVSRGDQAGGTDAGAGPALLYASADPGRGACLAIREASDTIWRDALLLRDWLGEHDGERDAFAAVKRQAQRQAPARYGERKEAWMAQALRRARAWARATGWSHRTTQEV
jgi:dephospho-CoA kinase